MVTSDLDCDDYSVCGGGGVACVADRLWRRLQSRGLTEQACGQKVACLNLRRKRAHTSRNRSVPLTNTVDRRPLTDILTAVVQEWVVNLGNPHPPGMAVNKNALSELVE